MHLVADANLSRGFLEAGVRLDADYPMVEFWKEARVWDWSDRIEYLPRT
jgi:hypothetical protein